MIILLPIIALGLIVGVIFLGTVASVKLAQLWERRHGR